MNEEFFLFLWFYSIDTNIGLFVNSLQIPFLMKWHTDTLIAYYFVLFLAPVHINTQSYCTEFICLFFSFFFRNQNNKKQREKFPFFHRSVTSQFGSPSRKKQTSSSYFLFLSFLLKIYEYFVFLDDLLITFMIYSQAQLAINQEIFHRKSLTQSLGQMKRKWIEI